MLGYFSDCYYFLLEMLRIFMSIILAYCFFIVIVTMIHFFPTILQINLTTKYLISPATATSSSLSRVLVISGGGVFVLCY